MEMSVVVLICALLTILGITLMVKALRNKHKSTRLSAFHALLTFAVFGVFTGYMVGELPDSANNWPKISYVFYAIAGILAIVSLFANKLFEFKLSKWVPISYGTFEVLGFATLIATVFTISG